MNNSTTITFNLNVEGLKIDEKEELELGNFKKAELFGHRNSIRLFKGNIYEYYPLSVNNNEIGKYSLGIQLYLNFLKSSSIIFLIMSLITIPALLSNYSGNGLSNSQTSLSLDLFSLANQPTFSINETFLNSPNITKKEKNIIALKNYQDAKKFQEQMELRLFSVSLPDLLYTIIFLIFILYLRVSNTNQRKTFILHHTNVNDFAIEITGFPENIVNENEIRHFFEKFGDVVEVKIARNYYGTLFNHKKQSKLEKKYYLEKKKFEIQMIKKEQKLINLEKKILILKEKNEKILKEKHIDKLKHDEYPSLKAFVIFNSHFVRNEVLKQFQSYNKNALLSILTCYNKENSIPKELKLNELFLLKISIPDLPSNILWENLECTKSEKIRNYFISILIVSSLIFVTFAIIMAATIVQGINPSSCENQIKISEINKLDNMMVECFCQQTSYNLIFQNSEIKNLCSDYIIKATANYILIILSGFVIVFINNALKWVLKKMAKFERYKSLTEEAYSLTIKIFIALFVNTAIITMIMHANIFGFIPTVALSNIIPPLHNLLSKNSTDKFINDFDRQWYSEVGSKIMIGWIINVASPHCFHLFYVIYNSWMKKRASRYALFQKELNDCYLGAKFEVITKYAVALNTIFVTLFYCSGMPLLLILGCLSLAFQYWMEKYLILRYYRRPPFYDANLNTKIIRLLPIAVIFHLAVGIYAYGSEKIFPYKIDILSFSDELNRLSTSLSVLNINEETGLIYNRCMQIIWLFGILIIVIIFYLFDISIIKLCQILWKKKISNKIYPDSKKDLKYIDELHNLAQNGLASYEIQYNNKYKDLIKAINGDFIKTYKNDTAASSEKNISEEQNPLKIINL